HLHTSLRSSAGEVLPLDELLRRRFVLFTGIADPASLERQLRASYADSFAASRFFPDHHAFSNDDLIALRRAAAEVNAHVLLTSEKDWVKIAPLATARDGLPILRLDLQLRFRDDGDRKLLEIVEKCLTGSSQDSSPARSSSARPPPVARIVRPVRPLRRSPLGPAISHEPFSMRPFRPLLITLLYLFASAALIRCAAPSKPTPMTAPTAAVSHGATKIQGVNLNDP